VSRVASRSTHLPALISVLLMIPLVSHAYAGSYSRYVADDYCTAGILSERGLMRSQVYWYTTWSGRFSFTASVNLLELIGPSVVPYLPAIALILWLGAATLCIRQWTNFRTGSKDLLLSFMLSQVLLVATFDATPNVFQSLYWQTGMLTYSFPLILVTAILAIAGWLRTRAGRSPSTTAAILVGGPLALIVGGYSETIVSVQTAALMLLLALLLWNPEYRTRGALRSFTIACLIGSLVAMALVIAAPGNATRQAEMPAPPGLLTLAYLSNRYALAFSAKAILASPLTVLLCAALAFFVGGLWANGVREPSLFNLPWGGRRSRALPIVAPAFLGYALILATTAPYVYTIGTYPDDRVLVTAQYILDCTLALCGFELGLLASRHSRASLGARVLASRSLPYAVAVISLASCLWATQRIWTRVPEMRAYARSWDQRHTEIQRAVRGGATSLVVERLPRLADLGDVSREPERWINICIARAYGLESIQRR
jgi:uncharacterized membrane protein